MRAVIVAAAVAFIVSLLMGVLVGMGRMSGDSEVVALIASGLPRTRLLRPVILVALIVTGVMLYMTFTWLPQSVHQLTDLKANQSIVFQGLTTEIKPRIFEESIPQKVLYIEDMDRARNQWRNVFLVSLGNDPFLGNSQVVRELLIKDIKAWGEYARLAKIEPL